MHGPLSVKKRNYSVCVARLPQSYWNETYQKLWMQVSYIFIALAINIYILYRMSVYCREMCIYKYRVFHDLWTLLQEVIS